MSLGVLGRATNQEFASNAVEFTRRVSAVLTSYNLEIIYLVSGQVSRWWFTVVEDSEDPCLHSFYLISRIQIFGAAAVS